MDYVTAELGEAEASILFEPLGNIWVEPASHVLEGQWQIPVIERHLCHVRYVASHYLQVLRNPPKKRVDFQGIERFQGKVKHRNP